MAPFAKPGRPATCAARFLPGVALAVAVTTATLAVPPASPAPAPVPERSARDLERRQRIDAMYEEYREAFPDVPDVTARELLEADAAARPVLVDVRPEDERAVSTIPGAIALDDLEASGDAYRGHRIVCFCTVGYRSGRAAAELRRDGWDAANLAGSLLAWVDEGGPLVDANGPTRRVHVYGERWSLLPSGYEPVW
ncbi:MAG TPA: rhodanese-like domain-containing protein [bacterium]|nr:rhodanese-like domain-containing protein [bacterium]